MTAIDWSKVVTAEAKAAEATAATMAAFQGAIQAHVDETARSRNYDSGGSLASYVASTNPQWAAEAEAFVAWRDSVWTYAYGELARVETGERSAPASPDAFIAELPVIEWPAPSA